mmetsp:Transcript_26942/g.66713  ORF Transcript_26942/g.66713 Transcript_26942/m.66713 type:complete len:210 (+) Transcript_26942:172-801(+)
MGSRLRLAVDQRAGGVDGAARHRGGVVRRPRHQEPRDQQRHAVRRRRRVQPRRRARRIRAGAHCTAHRRGEGDAGAEARHRVQDDAPLLRAAVAAEGAHRGAELPVSLHAMRGDPCARAAAMPRHAFREVLVRRGGDRPGVGDRADERHREGEQAEGRGERGHEYVLLRAEGGDPCVLALPRGGALAVARGRASHLCVERAVGRRCRRV